MPPLRHKDLREILKKRTDRDLTTECAKAAEGVKESEGEFDTKTSQHKDSDKEEMGFSRQGAKNAKFQRVNSRIQDL